MMLNPRRGLRSLGPHAVVVKVGAEGSLVYDTVRGRLAHFPNLPCRTQDATGAGDAYCSGFLAGYLLGQGAVSAAKYGTLSTSYVVEAVGALATRQPTETKACERLAAVAERTVQMGDRSAAGLV
jgi:sugar/nucleoside kinase (ribokinase family)